MLIRHIWIPVAAWLVAACLTVGCSRELKTKDERRVQPFPFDRIPALGNRPSSDQTGMEGQASAGQEEPAIVAPTPEVLEGQETASEDPEINRLMDEGRQALTDDRYDEAIERFQKVIARDPANVRALYNIGYAYRQLGNWDSAIEFAKKAAEADPAMLGVHQNLGYAYGGKGDMDSAIFEFEEELRRHPDEPRLDGIAERLALIYLERGLRQEAFDAANQAVNLNPNQASHYVTLADVHISNGAYDQAVTALEKACSLDPQNALFRKRLGDALWEAGREDEARRAYAEAVALEPALADSIPPARLAEESSPEDDNPLDEPL
jgi:tetratricopeptide (TPR) repeat protein